MFIAYRVKTTDGPGGYLGLQVKNRKNKNQEEEEGTFGAKFNLIFSIWDADRWKSVPPAERQNDEKKIPKNSRKRSWPVDMTRCKR